MTTLKSPRRQVKMKPLMGRSPIEPDESSYEGRFAARLKSLRIAAGLDHERAAAAITRAKYTISKSSVYRWEQGGGTTPPIEAFPAIAEAYGVSVRALLPTE